MKDKQFDGNYDVFHAFLVENAYFDGYIELPIIKTSNKLPEKVVTFSKAMSKSWSDSTVGLCFMNMTKNLKGFGITQNSIWKS